MNNIFKLLDVVALKKDLPGKKLLKGSVGTIVEIFDGDAFLVEFSNVKGQVYATEELGKESLMKLHYEMEKNIITS